MYRHVHIVFFNSPFDQSLCGGVWKSLIGEANAFDNLGTSTAGYKCCSAGSYMTNRIAETFSQETSCQTCTVGRWSSVENNDMECNLKCAPVPSGTCTSCISDDVSGCTSVSCLTNKFNDNNNATDGCETSCITTTGATCTACSDSSTCDTFEAEFYPVVTKVNKLENSVLEGQIGIDVTIDGLHFLDIPVKFIKITAIKPGGSGCDASKECLNIVRESNKRLRCKFPEGGDGCTSSKFYVTIADKRSKEGKQLCYKELKDQIVPADVVVHRSITNSSSNVVTPIINISWSAEKISDSSRFFEIQLSDANDFFSTLTWQHKAKIPASSRSVIINIYESYAAASMITSPTQKNTRTQKWNEPLWKKVVYIRVKANEGIYSPSSLKWTTAEQCNGASYLDDKISDTPTDWICQQCPNGASCEANTPYFGVKAMFGYYRIPSTTIPKTIPNNFTKCLFPGACLG
jgi:hypothetical protein